jgi:hypothetical protein
VFFRGFDAKPPQFSLFTVYANSLLAALNARNIIHGEIHDVDFKMVSIPTSLLASRNIGGSTKVPTNITIRVDTKKESQHDQYTVADRKSVADRVVNESGSSLDMP